jgi:hypothetical protein
MLLRREELHVRPAFLGQLEIDARRRDVDEGAAAVEGEVVVEPGAEFGELLVAGAADPAHGRDLHVLVAAPIMLYSFLSYAFAPR